MRRRRRRVGCDHRRTRVTTPAGGTRPTARPDPGVAKHGISRPDRDAYRREPIVLQQVQQVAASRRSVFVLRTTIARILTASLPAACVPVSAAAHEPQDIAGRFDAHCHRVGQRRIEASNTVSLVDQFLLAELPGVRVRTATCCFRLCKSQPTKIMRAVSFLAALPRSGCSSVATARDRSHDISDDRRFWTEAPARLARTARSRKFARGLDLSRRLQIAFFRHPVRLAEQTGTKSPRRRRRAFLVQSACPDERVFMHHALALPKQGNRVPTSGLSFLDWAGIC